MGNETVHTWTSTLSLTLTLTLPEACDGDQMTFNAELQIFAVEFRTTFRMGSRSHMEHLISFPFRFGKYMKLLSCAGVPRARKKILP